MKKIISIILIAFSFSCSNDGMGEFDNINTSDAIKFMFKTYSEGTKREGLTSKLKYDAHSLQGFWIYDGKLIDDDSLKSSYISWDKQNKISDYKLENVQVFPINKTNASYHYRVEIIYLDSSKT